MATVLRPNFGHRDSARPITEDIKLQVAVGKSGDLGKVTNKEVAWSKIVAAMRTPLRVDTTFKQYKAWSEQGQQGSLKKLTLKKQAGFVFGGWCAGGVRKKANIEHHSFVMLDMDSLSLDLFWKIEEGETLAGVRHVWHTTIGHSPTAPRVRIAIPLSRTVNEIEFQAVSRLLARTIDPEMTQVDPVSFRTAQMMFKPVVTKNGAWASGQDDGLVLDVDGFLGTFDFDWQNIALLPTCPKEKREDLERQSAGKKAEDPTQKSGLVGDFCRMWDIEAAMAEFIPDVYEPAGDGRFTFTAGHGHSGAVLYDGGKFLFSNHGSDPCADQNVNAFDMVRIHLFGDLDKTVDEGDLGGKQYDSPAKRPSYKAMVEKLADEYPEFAQARAANRYLSDDEVDERFDDVEADELATEKTAIAKAVEPQYDDLGNEIEVPKIKGMVPTGDANWLQRLDVNEDGVIRVTHANITKILQFHPRYAPCLEYNVFTGRVSSRSRPRTIAPLSAGTWDVQDSLNGIRWSAHMRGVLSIDLSEPVTKGKSKGGDSGLGLKVPVEMLKDCIEDAARKKPYHPVREYLQSGQWDCKPRAETMFIDWLGVEDSPYTRAATRMFMLAAVARVMEPGTKFDYMPVLEGAQGIGKSFFIQALGKHWAGDLVIDFDDERKTVNSTTGCWIMEFGELKGMRGDKIEEMRHFLTKQVDRVRLAYREDEEDFPRQWVVIATTNEDAYLYDTTGNRRFLPMRCTVSSVDLAAFRQIVDQIWFEAYCWYQCERIDNEHGSLPLWFADADLQAEAKKMQESRHVSTGDEWRTLIEEFLETPVHPDFVDGKWGDAEAAKLDDSEVEPVKRNVTCRTEILVRAIGIDRAKIQDRDIRRLKAILVSMKGWKETKKQKRFGHPVGIQKRIIRIGSPEDYGDEH